MSACTPVVWYAVFSPLIPLILLFRWYFTPGANRIVVSALMMAVCAASVFLGNLYADHAHVFDGFRALGAIWGGVGGFVLSLVLFIVSVIKTIRP